jgi:hypothetical protein
LDVRTAIGVGWLVLPNEPIETDHQRTMGHPRRAEGHPRSSACVAGVLFAVRFSTFAASLAVLFVLAYKLQRGIIASLREA